MGTKKESFKHSDERIQEEIDLHFGRFRFTLIGRHPTKGKSTCIFRCEDHKKEFESVFSSLKKRDLEKKSCPCMGVGAFRNGNPLSFYQERIDRCYPDIKGQYEVTGRKEGSRYSELLVKCHKHDEPFEWRSARIGKNLGCKKCGVERIIKGKTKDLKGLQAELNKTFGFVGKTNIPKVEYLPALDWKAKKDFKYFRCNIHNEVFDQRPHYAKAGCQGCSECQNIKRRESKKNRTTYEEFKTKGREIHHNRYIYLRKDAVNYENIKSKVPIICKRCGGKTQISYRNHIYKRHGCHFCQNSKGENMIKDYLEKLGYKFEQQYTIDGDEHKYDFFIKKHNLLIEYDGKDHFEEVKIRPEAFVRNKIHDPIKDKLAKDNGITLLRISYDIYKSEDICAEINDVLKNTDKYRQEITTIRRGKAY